MPVCLAIGENKLIVLNNPEIEQQLNNLKKKLTLQDFSTLMKTITEFARHMYDIGYSDGWLDAEDEWEEAEEDEVMR